MTQRGFTLLEILVALVVLGFLMAGLAQGVRFGLTSWDVQTRRIAIGGDMDSVMRALRRMIEQADGGDANSPADFQGGEHTLALGTRLPLAASGGLTRDAEVGLGVDERHRLVLRAAPHPHAQALTPPAGLSSVLLDGVDHVDFAYWRGGAASGWRPSWAGGERPGLVRVHIGFVKGDRRHWPDLLAIPMRTRRED